MYHPQTTKTVQPSFYQKLINWYSDFKYCFRVLRRCSVLISRLARVQQVKGTKKEEETGKFSYFNVKIKL